MSAEISLRDRRRAQTVEEIKDAALRQLSDTGPSALSLRAVARAIGMTVQSLYHYFGSRDALLAALVRDAHDALADAVELAAKDTAGQPRGQRRMAASTAYRDWALQHRAQFLLIYGTPVPGFEAQPGDGTGDAAARLAAPFAEVVFEGWTPAQLAAIEPQPSPAADLIPIGTMKLPPGAALYFVELRARLHGLVMLELLGHLHLDSSHAELLFTLATRRTSEETDALQHAVMPVSASDGRVDR